MINVRVFKTTSTQRKPASLILLLTQQDKTGDRNDDSNCLAGVATVKTVWKLWELCECLGDTSDLVLAP